MRRESDDFARFAVRGTSGHRPRYFGLAWPTNAGKRTEVIKNRFSALPRARALVGRLDEEPHVNPNTGTTEFSLRDRDGYYVTVSALDPA